MPSLMPRFVRLMPTLHLRLLQEQLGSEAVVLRAPCGRGQLAAGTNDGKILLLDPRTGYQASSWLEAHHSIDPECSTRLQLLTKLSKEILGIKHYQTVHGAL